MITQEELERRLIAIAHEKGMMESRPIAMAALIKFTSQCAAGSQPGCATSSALSIRRIAFKPVNQGGGTKWDNVILAGEIARAAACKPDDQPEEGQAAEAHEPAEKATAARIISRALEARAVKPPRTMMRLPHWRPSESTSSLSGLATS